MLYLVAQVKVFPARESEAVYLLHRDEREDRNKLS